jgi:DNA-binding transcriptional ArsR family regulator
MYFSSADGVTRAQYDAELLAALAHPKRLRILALIAHAETSVGDISTALGIEQSMVSQHLGKLRDKKLVKSRRQAQTIFYQLDSRAAERLLAVITSPSFLTDLDRHSMDAEDYDRGFLPES